VTLFEWFARMLRNRESKQLEDWMAEAEGTGTIDMKGFVARLRQDLDAGLAGLALSWSQGQMEGQVTKLKPIWRQMYGPGNFDLKRKRMPGAA
jgi:transposase